MSQVNGFSCVSAVVFMPFLCVPCTAGKRKKQASAGAADTGNAEPGAGNANPGQQQEDEGEEDAQLDEVVDDANEDITAEHWTSWAAGLSVLCHGLAAAVQGEACSKEDVEKQFDEDMLTLMYEASPSVDAK